MSNTQTTLWLETKYDVFQGALETEDWELAKNVIDDIAESCFYSEATQLSKELLTKKMSVNEY